MSNTPKITAEERVYNDRLAKQEKWLSVVIGEDGERHYLANRDFWHGTFTTLRHKAQRYVSEDVALKKAREMQDRSGRTSRLALLVQSDFITRGLPTSMPSG